MHNHWHNIIRPKELLIDYISLSQSYGKFIIEPLERGYGITIGNTLRRILLSSLRGCAITSISIKNIQHEYIETTGLKEDLSEIILNFKSIQMSLLNNIEYVEAKIFFKGPCIIKAKDIQCANIKIFNQNLYICTLSSNINIEINLTIEEGKGYTTANQNKLELKKKDKLGIIWLDTNFSPIKKINYNVLNSRVGQRTDYDKLILEIWTNNSINPENALGIAAKILKEQMSIFINFSENEKYIEPVHINQNHYKFNQNLLKKIDELELSVRSANCLSNAKIEQIGDLVQKTENEMLKTKNFGRKSLKEIKDVLNNMNLTLNMKLTNWNKIKYHAYKKK